MKHELDGRTGVAVFGLLAIRSPVPREPNRSCIERFRNELSHYVLTLRSRFSPAIALPHRNHFLAKQYELDRRVRFTTNDSAGGSRSRAAQADHAQGLCSDRFHFYSVETFRNVVGLPWLLILAIGSDLLDRAR